MALFNNDWHCDEKRCSMFGFCAASGVQPSLVNEPLPERCLLPVNQHHARLDGCPEIKDLEMNARTMGWFCSLLILFGLLLGALVPGDAAWAVEARSVGTVAAVVNGVEIGRDDFRSELERVQRQQGIKGKLADETKLSELQREALENLISRELLFQESIRRKIAVPSAAVEKQMAELAGEFSSEAQFTQTLAKMGTNREKVRDQVARGLAVRALIDATISARITVSDDEVKAYYHGHRETFTQPPQVHLAHILISVDPSWTKEQKEAARERIAELNQRLMAGEELSRLAAEHSDCQSRSKGGDIGWFVPGQLAPSVEKAVDGLKVGQLSGVVEDRIGYHLIRVLERKDAYTPTLAESADKVRGLVKREKGLKELQSYVQKLRDGARVEIRLVGE